MKLLDCLKKDVFKLIAVLTTTALVGCNTPTKAVDDSSSQLTENTAEAAKAASEETDDGLKIKRESSKLKKAGTNIVALVNGQVISSYDVKRRTAFLRLRRAPGANATKAKEELVEEAIKMQEARRLNVRAGDEQVNAAFANFAKGNRLTTSQMTQVLTRSGVTTGHFKEFIRGQISWNNAVGANFRQNSQGKTLPQTMSDLRKSGQQKPETNEYILQQTIFVLPKDKRKTAMRSRKAAAEAFRKSFQSCETTKSLAVGQSDVTVRELPRILEPQLPPEWKKQVIAAAVGTTTPILETDKGVEFLAVCKKKTVSDDTAAATVLRAKEFSGFNNEVGSKLSKELLAKLKKKSVVIYR